MVIHPYAKIWCAYVKEQRQSCQSQIHGENIISILMSKVKIIQRSWMYGTHCEMVINSSAKHSTTMSKDTRNRSKGQHHIGIMKAWHIISWWSSSLAKGFAHGPLSLHPWQIEQDFVIPADRHLAVFTSPAYEDDITFYQWGHLTDSCLSRCKMAAPNVYIFDCIHVMLPWWIVSGDSIGRS